MRQNCRPNFRDVLCGWNGAVERHCRRQIRSQPDGQRIGDVAPKTETGDSDLTRAERMRFQPERGGHEIFGHLVAVDGSEQHAAFVVVTGKAAHGGEPVRRKRHEVRQSEAARDVLDMRIQAAIFVDDDNPGQLRRRRVSCVGTHRPHEISLDDAVSLRRRDGFVSGIDPVIGSGHLLPQGVVRHQRFDNCCRSQPAYGKSLHTGHKVTPTDLAVNEEVIQLYRLTRQFGFRWLHCQAPFEREYHARL